MKTKDLIEELSRRKQDAEIFLKVGDGKVQKIKYIDTTGISTVVLYLGVEDIK